MPSFSYTPIKWPAEYHVQLLPNWLSDQQRRRCDAAWKVDVSRDRSVVVVTNRNGKSERLTAERP